MRTLEVEYRWVAEGEFCEVLKKGKKQRFIEAHMGGVEAGALFKISTKTS